MAEVSLLMDSVSVSSPGGERLQVELAAAVDRTCPEGATAVVVRRPDQTEIEGFERVRVEVVNTPMTSSLQKWQWFRAGLPEQVRRLAPTAIFAANGIFNERLDRLCGVVATTNNMLLFSPDQLRSYPTLSAARLRFRLLRSLTLRGLRRADKVVLHSRHALETLAPLMPELAAKTYIVLTGVPNDARLGPGDPPPEHPYGGKPFFFYLSALRRIKNQLGLIEGYRRLAEHNRNLPDLILAGMSKDPEYLTAVETAIAEASVNGSVRYLGEIPRASLRQWLHHASVNVFPSLCETNSVIQAEILGVGGVMAASDIAPMPEVAGGAADLFDPYNPDDIACCLERLWRDPERRRQLRELARARADELSWDRCGEVIWEAARAATEDHRRRAA